jgi:group I intron endonuclease
MIVSRFERMMADDDRGDVPIAALARTPWLEGTMPSKSSTQIGGVYAIRHVASGKMYIGSAANIPGRWSAHRSALKRDEHHSRHLQRAWDKYGPDAFVWEVLWAVEDPADLIRTEQEYLDHFGTYWRTQGYNIRHRAESSLGMRASAETRARMSAARKGRKFSPEHRARIGAASANCSPETRARISAIMKGHEVSPETRTKIAATLKGRAGRQHTPETRAKMAVSAKGRKLSPETRAKIGAAQKVAQKVAQKGKVVSAETRARMSAAQKGKVFSAEHRAKLSAAARRRSRHRPVTCQQFFAWAEE